MGDVMPVLHQEISRAETEIMADIERLSKQ
jgi:hypothetical protein